MKGVTLRGKTYWFRGRVKSRLVQVNLKTDDEEAAIREARAYLALLENPVVQAELKFSDAVEAFIAHKKNELHNSKAHIKMQQTVIEGAREFCGWPAPAVATRADVERWMQSKSNPRTRVQYLEILSRFFRWMVEKKRLKKNPCDGITRPRKIPKAVRRNFLTAAEASKLLTVACDDGLKFTLYCALHAGLRRGEVCAARRCWFDLERGLLHVTADAEWHAKDGDNRTIPLTKEFQEWLAGYIRRQKIKEAGSYMLRPGKPPGKHVYRVEFRPDFDAHIKACGVKTTFHDLRRTFASLHVSAGTSIYMVAKWLGDAVAVVEQHYGHLSHTGDEIEKAWEFPKKKVKRS